MDIDTNRLQCYISASERAAKTARMLAGALEGQGEEDNAKMARSAQEEASTAAREAGEALAEGKRRGPVRWAQEEALEMIEVLSGFLERRPDCKQEATLTWFAHRALLRGMKGLGGSARG